MRSQGCQNTKTNNFVKNDNTLENLASYITYIEIPYENFILLEDFNVEPTEDAMEEFMKVYNLKNLVKQPTCFKNPDNPSCIDLMLTNKSKRVHTYQIIETSISDFHKMIMTVLKVYFKKKGPTIIQYRDYKNLSNENFRNNLLNELFQSKIETSRLEIFVNSVLKVLNKNPAVKKRYIKANESPFMNKALKKPIIKRSQLRNLFLNKRTLESQVAYNKQRNYRISLLPKEKRNYFENTDTSKISDNKMF